MKSGGKLIVNIKVGQDLVGESYLICHKKQKTFIVSKKVEKIKSKNDYLAIQQSVIMVEQYLYYQSNKELLKYQDYKTFIEFTDEYDLNYDLNNKNQMRYIKDLRK